MSVAAIPILKMIASVCVWVMIAAIALLGAWMVVGAVIGFIHGTLHRQRGGRVKINDK